MKSIIIAIACFAATVTAADVCEVHCSGNWSGNTSLYFQVNANVDIIYDVEYKIFAVVNTNINYVVAINAKFILVLNIETGDYLLIDIKTNYAVVGNITINFISSTSIDYGKLVIQLNTLLTSQTEITSSTSGSFSFNLLIVAYANFQFDLTIIYAGQQQIIAILNRSFSVFLKQVQAGIAGGVVVITNAFEFVAIIIEYDYQAAVAIFGAIGVTVVYYQEVSIQLIRQLVILIQVQGAAAYNFAVAIRAYISVQINASIGAAIAWANNVKNNPVSLNVTLGGTSYVLVVLKIDQQYVISFRVASSSSEQVNVRIIFAGSALVIYNLRTDIAVVLYRTYAVIVNVNSNIAVVITSRLLQGLVVAIADASSLSSDIRLESYAKITADVKAIVNSNLKWVSTWRAFAAAVRSGVSAVVNIVGSANASIVVNYYGKFVIAGSSSSSFGGVVVAVFGSVSWGVSTILSAAITTIYTAGGSWGGVIKIITGGSFSVSA